MLKGEGIKQGSLRRHNGVHSNRGEGDQPIHQSLPYKRSLPLPSTSTAIPLLQCRLYALFRAVVFCCGILGGYSMYDA